MILSTILTYYLIDYNGMPGGVGEDEKIGPVISKISAKIKKYKII